MAMLTTKQAAERLGVAHSTLNYWRMLHQGPPYTRLSAKSFRYDERDLDKYILARRCDPTVRADLEQPAHGTKVPRSR